MYEDAFGGVRSCKGWREDRKKKQVRHQGKENEKEMLQGTWCLCHGLCDYFYHFLRAVWFYSLVLYLFFKILLM